MEYFMIENGKQTGPFTINQLAQKHITSETLVWAEGMSNWTPAWQVEQLKYIITGGPQQTPPPYSPENQPPVLPDSDANQNPQNTTDNTSGGMGASEENANGEKEYATTPPTGTQDEHLNEDKKKKKHTPWLIASAIIIVALLFFIFTNPNKQDHENAIKSELTTAIEKASNDNPNEQSDDIFTQGFSMLTRMITGTFFDTAMDNLLQYHNYLLFSKTTVHFDGRDHTVSFGILGKVHTLNEDDILKALDKTNPNQMDIQSRNQDQLPQDNDADQQDEQQNSDQKENSNPDQSANQTADRIASQISNKVQKNVEHKIEKEINQVTDSTTIDRVINRIMNIFGVN